MDSSLGQREQIYSTVPVSLNVAIKLGTGCMLQLLKQQGNRGRTVNYKSTIFSIFSCAGPQAFLLLKRETAKTEAHRSKNWARGTFISHWKNNGPKNGTCCLCSHFILPPLIPRHGHNHGHCTGELSNWSLIFPTTEPKQKWEMAERSSWTLGLPLSYTCMDLPLNSTHGHSELNKLLDRALLISQISHWVANK